MDTRDPLWAELDALVGVEESRPSMVARDPVSEAEIRIWADAIGDLNPVYRNPDLADRSVHGGIVAPPAMLQVWTLPPLDVSLPPQSLPPADLVRSPGNTAYELLDRLGYTSLIATNTDQVYYRYLRPGDLLTAATSIESISSLKRTSLGEGHFVTSVQTNSDQRGEVVASLRLRVLKFRPKSIGGDAAALPAPVTTPDTAFFWEGVERHQVLIQRCSSCRRFRHPPRPMCPFCAFPEWEAIAAGGQGNVFSYVVIPNSEGGRVVALVELLEGVRMVAGLETVPAKATIGMPVTIGFVPRQGTTLPAFFPTAANASAAAQEPVDRPAGRPAALSSGNRSLGYDQLDVDDLLPEWRFTLTPTMIVAGSIASRNFRDVHHAADRAQARGAKDIFMSITTTAGYVGRYVSAWAGPEALIRRVSLRLGAPNYPYDGVVFSGEVVGKRVVEGSQLVELAVRAQNGLGQHASAKVEIELGRGRLD